MTDLYTKLVANVLFPFHERLKSHTTVSVRKAMEKSQWMEKRDLESLQLTRLKKFLSDVDANVPYYSKLFKKIGFKHQEITAVSDIEILPFLTKSVIRENIDDLKSPICNDLSRFNTGGSSGEPLIFYIGNERVSHDVAAKWRATRWWDVDIGDPELVVWGSPIELGTQDRIKAIRDVLIRTTLFSAFEITDKKISEFFGLLRNKKPKMLFGYPSTIAYIAGYAEKNNINLSELGIKVVFVTSERLYDSQREVISRVFNCGVANGYGGRDAGFIAHQCPSGGMHITAEDIVVEIVDSQGKVLPHGESGELVVTHLATRSFPFIRYKTGDVGVLSDEVCACGRTLPLLKEIQGRTTDFVVASDGTIMHGLSLIYILRDIEGVSLFKIIQESEKVTRILIVTDESFADSSVAEIIKSFKARLGENVDVVVDKVDSIPREKSGKFRYVVSNVKQSI